MTKDWIPAEMVQHLHQKYIHNRSLEQILKQSLKSLQRLLQQEPQIRPSFWDGISELASAYCCHMYLAPVYNYGSRWCGYEEEMKCIYTVEFLFQSDSGHSLLLVLRIYACPFWYCRGITGEHLTQFQMRAQTK